MTIANLLVFTWLFQLLYFSESYIIGVYTKNDQSQIVHGGQFFSEDEVDKLADICVRLSGLKPILRSDTSLPTLIGEERSSNVISMVEMIGGSSSGEMPPTIMHAASVETWNGNLETEVKKITNILSQEGIIIKNYKINAEDHNRWDSFLKDSTEPIVVFYSNDVHSFHRSLSSTVAPLTEFQISQYQIVLWTTVMVSLVLLGAICSIVNMEVIPDSLLMAKFQSNRTGKRE